MAITDLTGTTHALNSTLTSYAGGTYSIKTYQVNIEIPQTIISNMGNYYSSFQSIQIGYDSGSEYNIIKLSPTNPQESYESCILATGSDTKTLPDTWSSVAVDSFEITGGTDATNTTLIAWIEDNTVVPFVPSPNFLDGLGIVNLIKKLKTKFQETLVSGSNIKTVNGNSLLGSGDIATPTSKVFYGTCDTGMFTIEKTVVCSDFTSTNLIAGTIINVVFTTTNAAVAPTLNVNGTGAYNITRSGNVIDSSTPWRQNECCTFVFDG